MSFLKKSERVLIEEIRVPRTERQRKELDLDHIKSLAQSIQRIGLIHPIVVTKDMVLVAGECRLEACRLLGLEDIDVRFNNEVDLNELKLIELEENVKRKDISWQDQTRATQELHETYKALDPTWTQEKTADVLGIDKKYLTKTLGVAQELRDGNPAVLRAEKFSEATTALSRARGKTREEISQILFDDPRPEPEAGALPAPEVLCADFLDWAPKYRGEKFSFIHCDFPYGVGMNRSGQASKALGTYEDTEDVYFSLLRTFVRDFFNFAYPMTHVLFWFSMKFYTETVEALRQIPEAKVFDHPLIWHKSDGKGIVPDAQRYGRRTYETALMVSVGDRGIIKVTNNSCAFPTDESRTHVSRKPPEMLEYFFGQFVDEGTRVLDPTCGSGSALQVAKKLGAKGVLGIERDEEFVKGITL